MKKRRENTVYFGLHILAAALCLLFPVYRFLTDRLIGALSRCFLHDFLHLYCPMCGGTRAVEALLQLRFADAVRYNVLAVACIAAVLVLDVIAFIRLLRGKSPFWRFPNICWIVFAVVLIAFGILRNVAMVFFRIDPVGDLGVFWL